MKKFNYDLFDNRKDLIDQDNSGNNGRMYHAPNGTYPSITNLLYEIVSKAGIQAWRNNIYLQHYKSSIRFNYSVS